MKITDEEIDEIARQRSRINRNSKYRTVYDSEYDHKGVCGEVALREFFGIFEHPSGTMPGGDGGFDVSVHLRDRNDQKRLLTVDVKAAVKPTWLWVEPPKKGRGFADVYVLAQYNEKTRRAHLIKWHWGEVVSAAPITLFGKLHHEIAATACLDLKDLRSRYAPTIHLCHCGDWGSFGYDYNTPREQWFCAEHKPILLL